MQGDSIHTSWRFVNYYFVLEPFSSLFGQRCEFLWETLHFRVRGWQRDCSSAGTLARAVALSHVLSHSPLRAGGKWKGSHGLAAALLLPCGFWQAVLLLEEQQGAQITVLTSASKIKTCHSASHFPSSFSLFISQLGSDRRSSLETPECLPQKQILHKKPAHIVHCWW